MSKLAVDTNVFVYALDKDSKYHHWSRSILSSNKFELYTTSKNITELLTVLTARKGFDLDLNVALKYAKSISRSIRVLFPDHLSMELLFEMSSRYKYRGIKVHDLEIAAIALSNEVYEIATQNSTDFKKIKELNVLSI